MTLHTAADGLYLLPSDQEVVPHLSITPGLTVMEELAVARSYAFALGLRLQHAQVRRLRWVIVGALAGACVAWVLDGSAAVKINDLLNALGWTA